MILLLIACTPECKTVYETNYIYIEDTSLPEDTSIVDSDSATDSVPYPDCSNSCYCWLNQYADCQTEIGVEIFDLEMLVNFYTNEETCENPSDYLLEKYACWDAAFNIDCADSEAFHEAVTIAAQCG